MEFLTLEPNVKLIVADVQNNKHIHYRYHSQPLTHPTWIKVKGELFYIPLASNDFWVLVIDGHQVLSTIKAGQEVITVARITHAPSPSCISAAKKLSFTDLKPYLITCATDTILVN